MTLLTPAQLAKKYPVSRSTIYSACQHRLLKHLRVPSKPGARGRYLIDEAEFLRWLQSLTIEPGQIDGGTPLKHIKL